MRIDDGAVHRMRIIFGMLCLVCSPHADRLPHFCRPPSLDCSTSSAGLEVCAQVSAVAASAVLYPLTDKFHMEVWDAYAISIILQADRSASAPFWHALRHVPPHVVAGAPAHARRPWRNVPSREPAQHIFLQAAGSRTCAAAGGACAAACGGCGSARCWAA